LTSVTYSQECALESALVGPARLTISWPRARPKSHLYLAIVHSGYWLNISDLRPIIAGLEAAGRVPAFLRQWVDAQRQPSTSQGWRPAWFYLNGRFTTSCFPSPNWFWVTLPLFRTIKQHTRQSWEPLLDHYLNGASDRKQYSLLAQRRLESLSGCTVSKLRQIGSTGYNGTWAQVHPHLKNHCPRYQMASPVAE